MTRPELWRAIVLLGIALAAACEVDASPDGPPQVTECGLAHCTAIVSVDTLELQACLGYDGGWPEATPAEVVNSCTPPPASGDCAIAVEAQNIELADRCGCQYRERFGNGCDCCQPPSWDETVEEWGYLGGALFDLLAQCAVEPVLTVVCDPQATCGELQDTCGPEDDWTSPTDQRASSAP